MSIQDVIQQFKAEIGEAVQVQRVTMQYGRDADTSNQIEVYSFRVSKGGGAATTIDVECKEQTSIPVLVSLAAEKTRAWAAANE